MAKILIADTVYPSFIADNPINPAGSYAGELKALLHQSFGTFDAYSRNLAALGWDAVDVIANHNSLQELWAFENPGWYNGDRLEAQIHSEKPDIVFLQDLSLLSRVPNTGALIAAQCSCAIPENVDLKRCDVIFSSLPHHVETFNNMGIRSVFLPLAFDPVVLERTDEPAARDIDVSFVGALSGWQWKAGTDLLEAIAKAIPTARFYGYGYEHATQAVQSKYFGTAWGNQMYSVYRRSKITLNRHGEIAQNCSNNLRMYEATGCGSLLITERFLNLRDFFRHDEVCAYGDAEEAVYHIRALLNKDEERRFIAENGQRRTLRDHTYAKRMETVSKTLTEMLVTV